MTSSRHPSSTRHPFDSPAPKDSSWRALSAALAIFVVSTAPFISPFPALACSIGNSYLGSAPVDGTVVAPGEVWVALHYLTGDPLSDLEVTDELGAPLSFERVPLMSGVLLRVSSGAATEIRVHDGEEFLPTESGWRTRLYVDAEVAAPTSVPAPQVTVGDTACVSCNSDHSCCTRSDGAARYDSPVSVIADPSAPILAWLDEDGELEGVFTSGTFRTDPSSVGDIFPARPSPGASILALSSTGARSSTVSYEIEREGACSSGLLRGPSKWGCFAGPTAPSGGAGWLALAFGMLALLERGRRRRS